MKVELFIARRLKLGNGAKSASPSLNVATVGIVLAILIMILSVVIVLGFKSEITHKLYAINPHLKVSNAALGIDDNISTVNGHEVFKGIKEDTAFFANVQSMSLIAEKPAIMKTDDDFMGVVYRGVDDGYDWSYIASSLTEGRLPNLSDTADTRKIVVSKKLSNQLRLKVGDKLFSYFIDNKVKARRSVVVGIYNTDFDAFDKSYIIGNIGLLQSVNGWNGFTGNYVGVNLRNTEHLETDAPRLYAALARSMMEHNYPTLHNVSTITQSNGSYFTWLNMLDMNVIIILSLMVVVSSFTLISALLMIILERIRMIGVLKSLGCSNVMIRKIFIYLTGKLIVRSIIIGNAIGLGLALIQKYFHVIKLDSEAYYMSYVPIEFNATALLLLNAGIIIISYVALIGPSHIVSTIKPTSTMKFE
ncbi:MAG: ABC transporter permease [Bacteroidales bacterium]|nr:ABC transporter permease [Bacteroidales bacterium]